MIKVNCSNKRHDLVLDLTSLIVMIKCLQLYKFTYYMGYVGGWMGNVCGLVGVAG